LPWGKHPACRGVSILLAVPSLLGKRKLEAYATVGKRKLEAYATVGKRKLEAYATVGEFFQTDLVCSS
jgi:hypothetical protein